MSKPEHIVVFRADASQELGTGHVRRCLALDMTFKKMGWRTEFATNSRSSELIPELAHVAADVYLIDEHDSPIAQADALVRACPNGVDVAVIDHYGLGDVFERRLAEWAHLVVVLDDLANRRHDCDLLFDSGPGRLPRDYATFVPPRCEVLTGPGYALLAPSFAAFRQMSCERRSTPHLERIAISLGGGDPGPILQRVLEGIAEVKFAGEVEVVLGRNLPLVHDFCARNSLPDVLQVRTGVDAVGMAQIFARADLAIGAGGSSSWERCCLGLPTLVVVTALNQRAIVEGLAEAGAVVVAGWHEEVTASGIGDLLSELMSDTQRLSVMSRAAAGLCDGQGAGRVVEAIVSRLREAE